jgi:protein ImuB
MSYAVLRAPDFALQALRRGRPELHGRPVGLCAGEGRHAIVAEASAEAKGVEPGLAVSLAAARCPGLILAERDPDAEVECQRLLLAAAFTLSPRVESTQAGCCTADLRGADPEGTARRMPACLTELARAGLSARIGVASTPILAAYAARLAEPVLFVDDPAGFLRPLPLAWAGPSPAQEEILGQWGIRTLGALAALPKAEVGRRLGPAGASLWERAAGQEVRILRTVEPPRVFAAEWPYEPPVEAMEPLLFRLRRFAERLAFELRASGWVASELSLTLLLEDDGEHRRKFPLAEPSSDVDGWMRVVSAHLETVRTAARVSGVRLVASPARPPQRQDGLFDTPLNDPAAFWENLARVGAVVGPERVGTPVPADTHRPDALDMARPAAAIPPAGEPPVHPPMGPALRRFRPAWPVRVSLEGARPAALSGDRGAGAIRAARGPWLASGDWWRPDAWARETWQVELETGELYQLARTSDGWRIEGIWD